MLQLLAQTCRNMKDAKQPDPNNFFQTVHTYVLNPKSITMGELYGEVNKLTLEWHDGLMAVTIRHAVQVSDRCYSSVGGVGL
jgi:dynein heavy chain